MNIGGSRRDPAISDPTPMIDAADDISAACNEVVKYYIRFEVYLGYTNLMGNIN